jgi:hypothetical protein
MTTTIKSACLAALLATITALTGCTTLQQFTPQQWTTIARTSGKAAVVGWRLAAKPSVTQQCEVAYGLALVHVSAAGLTNITTYGESLGPLIDDMLAQHPGIAPDDLQAISDGLDAVLSSADLFLAAHPDWQTYADYGNFMDAFCIGALSKLPLPLWP